MSFSFAESDFSRCTDRVHCCEGFLFTYRLHQLILNTENGSLNKEILTQRAVIDQ